MRALVQEFWPILLPTLLVFAAVYLLLPRVRRSHWAWGALLAGVGIVLVLVRVASFDAIWQEKTLFVCFSAVALAGGVMLITHQNPAHAALSFTLVIVASCGLFLLNAAPFLMAATLIIYAGAIVVTFLFVIMLAQNAGYDSADARSREPFLSCLAGFILVGATFCVIQRTYENEKLDRLLGVLRQVTKARTREEAYAILGNPRDQDPTKLRLALTYDLLPFFAERRGAEDDGPPGAIQGDILNLEAAWNGGEIESMKKLSAAILTKSLERYFVAQPEKERVLPQDPFSGLPSTETPQFDAATGRIKERLPANNTEALGLSLFTEYLVPVLGAAILLLVATIGAIAIAGRRTEELR
ncbi:MAG: NADH-quinone oxidoreductase subunit J [Gemmataceae bacterium]